MRKANCTGGQADVIAYALDSSGFITARSSIGADISLLVSVAAIVLLTTGVVLARTRHYDAHRWVQTSAVILNAVLVVIWMIVSLVRFILPGLPGTLSKQGHTLAAVHAVTGAVGVALGVFVVIAAGRLTSRGQSVGRYKNVMRAAYVVYLAAFVLGLWLYRVTYG
jgi:uncharacterized membrane protein YozB (DUF420 family)